jgi:hypothetical protein
MRTFNATLSMLSVVALAFGNGIYLFTTVRCAGLSCVLHDAGAMFFIGLGIALGVLPWLLSLARWLFSGPGGNVPGVLPFAPLLPVGVFLLVMETGLKLYFESHFSFLVGALMLSLLLTPILTLIYNTDDRYWAPGL